MKLHKKCGVLNKTQEDLIVGSLLGDAYLVHNQYSQNWSMSKTQSKYDKDHVDKKTYIDWHHFMMGDYSNSVKERIFKKSASTTHKQNIYYAYVYSTHAHPVFTSLAKKWYKNDSFGNWEKRNNRIIKIIPNDIKLTPLSLCIWLMDDGFCYAKDANAILCTHCYTRNECEFLVERLKNDLSIISKVREVKKKWKNTVSVGNIIYIGRKSYFNMIELINPHIAWDCLKYKTDIETYNKIDHRGENHSMSKLTENDVKKIFELREQGMTHKTIASIIGISKTNITLILNGKRWTYLNLSKNESSTRNNKPHLKEDDRAKIVEISAQGHTPQQLAEMFNVSRMTVCRILNKHASTQD